MKNILSPEEQFEVAKDNYKPNSRYNGITSYPIMMFSGSDTLEDKINKIIKWLLSIKEDELAEKLREYMEVFEGVQRELDKNIKIYKDNTFPDSYRYGAVKDKINVLCRTLNKRNAERIIDNLINSEYEGKLFE